MRGELTVRGLLARALRRWRPPRWASVALLALPLALGLAEPLLCILHCELWMPGSHAAGHAHPSAPESLCQHVGAPGSGSAHYVPPSPVHEMLLALAPLAAALAVSHTRPRPRAAAPASLRRPPPLRPPIPCA